jgi:hypothetical protein
MHKPCCSRKLLALMPRCNSGVLSPVVWIIPLSTSTWIAGMSLPGSGGDNQKSSVSNPLTIMAISTDTLALASSLSPFADIVALGLKSEIRCVCWFFGAVPRKSQPMLAAPHNPSCSTWYPYFFGCLETSEEFLLKTFSPNHGVVLKLSASCESRGLTYPWRSVELCKAVQLRRAAEGLDVAVIPQRVVATLQSSIAVTWKCVGPCSCTEPRYCGIVKLCGGLRGETVS